MYNDDPLYGNEGHTHSLLRSESTARAPLTMSIYV